LIIKVSFDFDLGIPIIPADIKERVRQGEQVDIEILPQISGFAKNALRYGVAGLWIDGVRVGTNGDGADGGVWGSSNKTCQEGRSFNASPTGEEYRSQQHPQGRWPPNIILSHTDQCVRTGTKRVRGSQGVRGASTNIYGGGKGFTEATGEQVGYTDPDGYEEVESWICSPSCPVRLVGEDSGESKSSDRTRNNGANRQGYHGNPNAFTTQGHNDHGTAARYFPNLEPDANRFRYCPKAPKSQKWLYCAICDDAYPVSQIEDHAHGKPERKSSDTQLRSHCL